MTVVTDEIRLPRTVLVPVAWLGMVIGWTAGRTPVAIGWAAGRAFLLGAFFIEAVIYGFRQGAMLGPKQAPGKLTAPLDTSKAS